MQGIEMLAQQRNEEARFSGLMIAKMRSATGVDRLVTLRYAGLGVDQLSQINATNLDDSGRAFLSRVRQVFTTEVGAQRLGGNAVGLAPWETEKFASVE